MELIPRGAHHRLGILERNHTVRRKMLETFKAEMPDCSFEKALLVTAHQRNRLSSVRGATPATLALGYVPSEGGVMDEPGPESGDQADLPRILEIKQKAAIAFHKANQDLALRAALPFIVHEWMKMNSLSVTGFSTGSLKVTNLTPFGGEDLLWSLQSRPASTEQSWFEQHGNKSVMRRCLNDKPDQKLRMTYKGLWPNASWLLSRFSLFAGWLFHSHFRWCSQCSPSRTSTPAINDDGNNCTEDGTCCHCSC